MAHDYRSFYRRHLPHIQPEGAPLFVTFRLYGSVPKATVLGWNEERTRYRRKLELISEPDARQRETVQYTRRKFLELEQCLDAASTGPTWLREDRIAGLVAESLENLHRAKEIELAAFCIMSNHVHAVFTPLAKGVTPFSLAEIMQQIKGRTSRAANALLKRNGSFWESESYDHYVRDEAEYARIVEYVLNNPVKAGLVEQWNAWRWSYTSYNV